MEWWRNKLEIWFVYSRKDPIARQFSLFVQCYDLPWFTLSKGLFHHCRVLPPRKATMLNYQRRFSQLLQLPTPQPTPSQPVTHTHPKKKLKSMGNHAQHGGTAMINDMAIEEQLQTTLKRKQSHQYPQATENKVLFRKNNQQNSRKVRFALKANRIQGLSTMAYVCVCVYRQKEYWLFCSFTMMYIPIKIRLIARHTEFYRQQPIRSKLSIKDLLARVSTKSLIKFKPDHHGQQINQHNQHDQHHGRETVGQNAIISTTNITTITTTTLITSNNNNNSNNNTGSEGKITTTAASSDSSNSNNSSGNNSDGNNSNSSNPNINSNSESDKIITGIQVFIQQNQAQASPNQPISEQVVLHSPRPKAADFFWLLEGLFYCLTYFSDVNVWTYAMCGDVVTCCVQSWNSWGIYGNNNIELYNCNMCNKTCD